jgi:uncharacterized protein
MKQSWAVVLLAAASFGGVAPAWAAPSQSDMLTALGASGPNPAFAQAKAFDGIIGAWEFDCTLTPEGAPVEQYRGEWTFDWVLDGTAIQDVITAYRGGAPQGQKGTTLRYFDRKQGYWRVLFIVPLSGKVIDLHGGQVGERIVLEGVDVTGALLRWSFNDMQPDSFLWRGETSSDGGKSWRVEQVMKLRRKHAS